MKEVSAKQVNGQWKVEVKYDNTTPMTLRDFMNLCRAVKLEVKASLRRWNLQQRALSRKVAEPEKLVIPPILTGQKG